MIAVASLPLALAACKPPPDEGRFDALGSVERGKAAIEKAGCAACHTIAGIDWPQGTVGPRLDGFSGRGLIAGRLPDRPGVLADYIRDAPALVPGSAMPAMPVSRTEARDIAAYLYAQEAR